MIRTLGSAANQPNVTPGSSTSRRQAVDSLVWMALAALLIVLHLSPSFVPTLNQDSFQYLSAAANALQGLFGYTSLIHFDVERSFGVSPAPMVTFALGYPLAIAAVGLTGTALTTAALLVSTASTMACVPVLMWIARQLGFSRLLCNATVACFVVNGIVIEFGGAALSEALCSLCMLLGVALLLRGSHLVERPAWPAWVAAGLAFAAAYLVRYAGLFFIVGLGLLTLRHVAGRNRKLARGHAIALGVALLAVLVVVGRNMVLVGNWRGRDEMLVNNPLVPALVQTAQGLNALTLGSGTSSSLPGGTFIPKVLFTVLFLSGLAILAWARWRDRGATTTRAAGHRGMAVDIFLLAATYSACMFYAGMTSSISYGDARNLVPIASLLVLLLGWGIHAALSSVPRFPALCQSAAVALAASFCIYAYLNAAVLRSPALNAAAPVVEMVEGTVDDGKSIRSVIGDIVGPGVILANNGQALGHVLGLRTVSMVGPTFSTAVWDEAAVQQAIRRFKVAAVIISAPIAGQPEDDNLPSPFIRELSLGKSPAWLKLASRSKRILVYVPDTASR
ncbi:phospholipid carrier-dependent glycosyltransferase [Pseudomonas sp. P5_A2_2]